MYMCVCVRAHISEYARVATVDIRMYYYNISFKFIFAVRPSSNFFISNRPYYLS